MSKVFTSPAEAVADIRDGASVLVGGFGGGGTPYNLIDALLEQGAGGLTLIGNSYFQVWPLIEAGRVRRVVSSFPAPRDPDHRARFLERHARGEFELEVVPQGTFAERIRAGGAGLPAFYSPVGVGTELAAGKERRTFGGREYVLETAITADFALLKAWHADPYGNLDYHLAARNFNPAMAMAGRRTIVEVEAIVPLGDLAPAAITTPGIFVDRLVRAERQVAWTARGVGTPARIGAVKDSTLPRFGGKPRLTRELVALRVSRELRPGMVVNLGTGIPTVIANFVTSDSGVTLHSENGLLGYGRFADEADRDVDLVTATGEAVTLAPGAAIVSSGEAFEMVRGGHVDLTVLGAYQVAENGDLANWSTAEGAGARGVGGAMDMVAGARGVIVAMEHTTLGGAPKLVERCTLPLTGRGVVGRVATDLAWIEVTAEGFLVREIAPGWTFEEVQALSAARLRRADDLREIEL